MEEWNKRQRSKGGAGCVQVAHLSASLLLLPAPSQSVMEGLLNDLKRVVVVQSFEAPCLLARARARARVPGPSRAE